MLLYNIICTKTYRNIYKYIFSYVLSMEGKPPELIKVENQTKESRDKRITVSTTIPEHIKKYLDEKGIKLNTLIALGFDVLTNNPELLQLTNRMRELKDFMESTILKLTVVAEQINNKDLIEKIGLLRGILESTEKRMRELENDVFQLSQSLRNKLKALDEHLDKLYKLEKEIVEQVYNTLVSTKNLHDLPTVKRNIALALQLLSKVIYKESEENNS